MNPTPFIPWVVGLLALALIALSYKLIFRLFGIVIVPEDRIGILNKKFVLFGGNKTLPDGRVVATNGEAGLQADTLAPGLHFGYWPWQYDLTLEKFVHIPQGQIGMVESRDGNAMPAGRVLADHTPCDNFQNAKQFLASGGQRGPQLNVIPPGDYRINTGLFKITLGDALEIPDDQVGIVTTMEGAALNTKAGQIAGPQVEGHNAFQNPQQFLTAGGYKGLQEQILLAGQYYINPQFAQVELKGLTTVPIAHVGVVVSYVGDEGKDLSGDGFKHGNLVHRGQRGVWAEPLDPGKYPVNPYTHKVEMVPTANIVLNWATGKTESHALDKNLSTISLRSADGFSFNLDVSQIIHIPRNEAPKVIARFGTVKDMVTQVLEPIIGNYFRNTAQSSDVISFLQARAERQKDAKEKIFEALSEYNVHAVDTLIGDIAPPQELMETLTQKKIAEQQKQTFATQKEAQMVRKDLAQAQAIADTQPQVVNAERQVQIQEFSAQAAVKKAEGISQAMKIEAAGEAERLRVTGAAEAERTLAIGKAEADVIKEKIASVKSDNYASIEVAKALASSQQPIVPGITVGGNGSGTGSITDVLLASMLKDQLTTTKNPTTK